MSLPGTSLRAQALWVTGHAGLVVLAHEQALAVVGFAADGKADIVSDRTSLPRGSGNRLRRIDVLLGLMARSPVTRRAAQRPSIALILRQRSQGNPLALLRGFSPRCPMAWPGRLAAGPAPDAAVPVSQTRPAAGLGYRRRLAQGQQVRQIQRRKARPLPPAIAAKPGRLDDSAPTVRPAPAHRRYLHARLGCHKV
jgi:hypothetical protein